MAVTHHYDYPPTHKTKHRCQKQKQVIRVYLPKHFCQSVPYTKHLTHLFGLPCNLKNFSVSLFSNTGSELYKNPKHPKRTPESLSQDPRGHSPGIENFISPQVISKSWQVRDSGFRAHCLLFYSGGMSTGDGELAQGHPAGEPQACG